MSASLARATLLGVPRAAAASSSATRDIALFRGSCSPSTSTNRLALPNARRVWTHANSDDDAAGDADANVTEAQAWIDAWKNNLSEVVKSEGKDDVADEKEDVVAVVDSEMDALMEDDPIAATAALESSLDASAMDEIASAEASKQETQNSWVNERSSGVKSDMLFLCGSSDRGLTIGSQTKRAEINERCSKLEALNLIENPTAIFTGSTNQSPLEGTWKLAYTDDAKTLLILAADGLPWGNVGELTQVITANHSAKENIFTASTKIAFKSQLLETSSFVTASLTPTSPKRLVAVVTETGVCDTKVVDQFSQYIGVPMSTNVLGTEVETPDGLMDSVDSFRQAVQSTISGISTAASESKLQVPVPDSFPGAQTWILTTYVDDSLRVARGDGGAVYIFERV